MRNEIILGLITSVLSFCIHTTASANDTAMGGTATDLVPIESAEVRMLSEDILISEDNNYWKVAAEYVFLNQSNEDVELQVGFPEHRCGPGPGEDEDDVNCISSRPLDFKSIRTTIDGVPVKHRKGKLNKRHRWAPKLGTVWVYDARFPAGKQVRISHHYRVLQSENSMGGRSGSYVTRTGAMWAGSIGHARFRVRFSKEATEIYNNPNDTNIRVSSHLIKVDGKSVGEIVFEADDWNPKDDIWYGYNSRESHVVYRSPDLSDAPSRAGFADSERCPNFDMLREDGKRIAKNADWEAKAVSQWAGRELGSKRICRNMVFAVYGRRFKDDALNRYFYGPKGFVPPDIRFPHQPFTPNDNYSDKLMTLSDWVTIRLIDKIDKLKSQNEKSKPEQRAAPSEATERATSLAKTDEVKPRIKKDSASQPKPSVSAGCGCNALNTSPVSRLGVLLAVALIIKFRSMRRLI